MRHPRAAGVLAIVRSALAGAQRHNLALVAAGVAFFCLLALFPALTALVSIYGLIGDPADIAGQIDAFSGIAPPSILRLADDQLQTLLAGPEQGLAVQGLVSLVVAFWSSQQGVRSFVHALNIVYDDTHRRRILPRMGMGLLFTFGAIAFVAAAVAAFAALPALFADAAANDAARLALRWIALFAIATLFATALFRWGPNRRPPPLRLTLPGALSAAMGWLLASNGFSYWAGSFVTYGRAYGSIASVVVLLLWLFVTVYVFLLGGEINAAIERDTRARSSS